MSTTSTAVHRTDVLDVPLDKITPGQNVRELDPEHVDSLATSIQLVGILTPLLVASIDDGYGLVAGHHRFAAAQQIGLKTVPVIVRDEIHSGGDPSGDSNADADAAIENIARKQLTPLEEAEAAKRMINRGFTEKGAAQALGWSGQKLANRLLLFRLPEKARALIHAGELPVGGVRALAAIAQDYPQLADELAERIATDAGCAREFGRQPEQAIARQMHWMESTFHHSIQTKVTIHDLGLSDDPIIVPDAIERENAWSEWSFDTDFETGESLTLADAEKSDDEDTKAHVEDFNQQYAEFEQHRLDAIARLKEQGENKDFDLDEIQAKYEQLKTDTWDRPGVVLNETDADQARAAGVLLEIGNGAWITSKDWLREHVIAFALDRAIADREEARQKAAAEKRERQAALKSGAVPKDEPIEKRAARLDRRFAKENSEAVRDSNHDLHRQLLDTLAKVDPTDKDVALFFSRTILGRPGYESTYHAIGADPNVGRSRECAAAWRLVDPACSKIVTPTLASGKPGKPKVEYVELVDAEKLMWKFIEGGKTAGEILGRTLVVLTAAKHAQSVGQPGDTRFYRSALVGKDDVPEKKLDTIVRKAKAIPASTKKVAKRLSDWNAHAAAREEAQQEAQQEAQPEPTEGSAPESAGEDQDAANEFLTDEQVAELEAAAAADAEVEEAAAQA